MKTLMTLSVIAVMALSACGGGSSEPVAPAEYIADGCDMDAEMVDAYAEVAAEKMDWRKSTVLEHWSEGVERDWIDITDGDCVKFFAYTVSEALR
jgi:hypothetical protein